MCPNWLLQYGEFNCTTIALSWLKTWILCYAYFLCVIASHVVNWSAKVRHESKVSAQQNIPSEISVVNEPVNVISEYEVG